MRILPKAPFKSPCHAQIDKIQPQPFVNLSSTFCQSFVNLLLGVFVLFHWIILIVEWHYQSHTLHPRSEMATLALWLTEGTHKCSFLWNSR